MLLNNLKSLLQSANVAVSGTELITLQNLFDQLFSNLYSNIKVVVLDPGHGGRENGAIYQGVSEDELNLILSYLIEYNLKLNHFINIVQTRDKDINISLKQRVLIAKAVKADAFISIHCDAYKNKKVEGMTVHISPNPSEQDIKLAECVSKKLKVYFPKHRHRGIKKTNLHVLRETIDIPSILVESEFMSNEKQLIFLKKPENQKTIAEAVSLGIREFLK